VDPCESEVLQQPAVSGFVCDLICVYYSILLALSQRPHLLSEFRSVDKWIHPPDYFTRRSLVLRISTLIFDKLTILESKA